jgi:hypothetical protein
MAPLSHWYDQPIEVVNINDPNSENKNTVNNSGDISNSGSTHQNTNNLPNNNPVVASTPSPLDETAVQQDIPDIVVDDEVLKIAKSMRDSGEYVERDCAESIKNAKSTSSVNSRKPTVDTSPTAVETKIIQYDIRSHLPSVIETEQSVIQNKSVWDQITLYTKEHPRMVILIVAIIILVLIIGLVVAATANKDEEPFLASDYPSASPTMLQPWMT